MKRVKGSEGSRITRIGTFPLSELREKKKCVKKDSKNATKVQLIRKVQ